MFQWLVRGWLARVAEEKIRAEVFRAAREQFTAAATHSAETAQGVPCDVGLVFALSQEAGGLEDRLEGLVSVQASGQVFHKAFLRKRRLVLTHSGAGRAAAGRAARTLIAGHQPGWVISAGFAGGLDRRLPRGAIVVADAVSDPAGVTQPIDLGGLDAWLAAQRDVHVGHLLTLDHIVRTAGEKQALCQAHQALAVDMETAAVAEVCRECGHKFLAVRVISDPADETLPPDLERLLSQRSPAGRWGAVLGTLLDRPGSVKDLYRLKEHALAATDALAKFLIRLIGQVAPERND